MLRTQSEKFWKNAKFCIFDVPEQRDKPYEERVKFLENYSKDHNWPLFLRVVEIVRCDSRDHLKRYLKEIVNKNGEGVMLREPESLYEAGRSNSMKKYKEFLDTEVRVVKNQFPHGLECQQ